MKKLLVIFCLLFMSLVSAEILKVGTNAEYAPYQFVDKNNKIVGFEIDIVEAIAKSAGFSKVEWKDQKFDSLMTSLSTKKDFDAVASAFWITEEKQKKALFTDPYFEESLVIIVRKDNDDIKNIKDFADKKIGVELGTTNVELIKQKAKSATIVELDTSYMFLSLQEQKVDAIIITKSAGEYAIKNGNLPLKVVGVIPPLNNVAMALKKNNTKLAARLNDALKEIKKNGEYQKIYDKWFSQK
ncbi:MAG: transporter substrate-binding domain-containing protein [Rickettsiales bacterium]|jgi:polar amino acid transport system substrate-binding protein|nr:transporter substrate-binding domain-containing protein [Rickettsiales bacterium]